MKALAELLALCADDAALAWHRWRRNAHAAGLAAAEERHRARIVAWVGHDPDRAVGEP